MSLIFADPGRRGGPERVENAEKIVSRKRSGPHTQTTGDSLPKYTGNLDRGPCGPHPWSAQTMQTLIQKRQKRFPNKYNRDPLPKYTLTYTRKGKGVLTIIREKEKKT